MCSQPAETLRVAYDANRARFHHRKPVPAIAVSELPPTGTMGAVGFVAAGHSVSGNTERSSARAVARIGGVRIGY